jgi:hypothetical protein
MNTQLILYASLTVGLFLLSVCGGAILLFILFDKVLP